MHFLGFVATVMIYFAVVLVLPIYSLVVLITIFFPKNPHLRKKIRLVSAVFALFAICTCSGLFVWALYQEGKDNFPEDFHLFNGHLKALCIERTNRRECPKNEAELMAFNPKAYQKLQKYWQTYYVYKPETQVYVWLMVSPNDFRIASSNILTGGFGIKPYPPEPVTPEWQEAMLLVSESYPSLVNN